MRKIILSTIIVGLLSPIFAADAEALTKATVKLIKGQNELQSNYNLIGDEINKFKSVNKEQDEKLSNHADSIKKGAESISINDVRIKDSLKEINSLKDESNSLKKENESLKKELNGFKESNKKDLTQLDNQFEKKNDATNRAISELNSKIENIQKTINSHNFDELNTAVKSLETKVETVSVTDRMVKVPAKGCTSSNCKPNAGDDATIDGFLK